MAAAPHPSPALRSWSAPTIRPTEDFMLKLYGTTASGNCYKPALLMRQLGVPFQWTEVDIINGGSRTPEFLARNPNGRVPLLEITDHSETRTLAESNAMLCYLAEGTHLLPDDRWPRAQVMQWLFFEQYSHEPYVATVRWWVKYLHKQDEWKDKISEAMKKGYAALSVMEQQLGKSPFLAGDRYTIADITAQVALLTARGALKLAIPEDHRNLARWWRAVTQRPTARA